MEAYKFEKPLSFNTIVHAEKYDTVMDLYQTFLI